MMFFFVDRILLELLLNDLVPNSVDVIRNLLEMCEQDTLVRHVNVLRSRAHKARYVSCNAELVRYASRHVEGRSAEAIIGMRGPSGE